MKIKGLSFFALMMAIATPVFADTMDEALIKAYNTNPDLAAAQAELRATDELAPQALSNYRPNISAQGSVGVTKEEGSYIGDQDYSSRNVSLQLQQPLYRGGRTRAAVRQADSSIAAQRAILRGTEQQVFLQGIQAYLNVLRDQEIVGLTKDNESVLTKELQASRDRFSVGEITKTDVSQSEARRSGSVAARIQAEGQLIQSQATYQRVFGEAPQKLTKPAEPHLDLPISLDEALDTALRNNPNVVAAMHNQDSAQASLDSVKGERLPEVTAQGSVTHNFNEGDYIAEGDTNSAQALISVTVPLYQAGAVSSRIRQARQSVSQSENVRDSAERQVYEQVISAWQSLETARASKVSLQSQVDAARVALDGVREEASVGSRSVLDTLDSEQEYLNARISLVRSDYDEIVAQYALLSAIGQLTAKDLQLNVDYYDDQAYAKSVRSQWIGSSIE